MTLWILSSSATSSAVQVQTATITRYLYEPLEIERLTEACGKLTPGCAFMNGRFCEIHVIREGLGRATNLQAHELQHCFDGKTH